MVPRGCLWFVIVVFPDHTHLLFWISGCYFLDASNFCTWNKIKNNSVKINSTSIGYEYIHVTFAPINLMVFINILTSNMSHLYKHI